MSEAVPYKNLPILLGTVRQETGEGELVLEQNDGVRRLYFLKGELIHLRSEAAGEQFGSYLLRLGILDLSALNELLANDESYRIGEKVIQWGMLSLEERDNHLQCLQERIMVHALEHPILHWTWNPGSMEHVLSQDLHFKPQHRHLIWRTFQEFNNLKDLLTILETETAWKWAGRRDLLDNLSDLPLTSSTAYALSFLTADPISLETFRFLSHLNEDEAGRFIATLWALGALVLSGGKLPSVTAARKAGPSKPVPALPLIMPPSTTPFGPPKQRVQEASSNMDQLDINSQPEFIDLDLNPAGNLDLPTTPQRPQASDVPPCGPRPQPRPESLPRPDDMPPCGPRPQPRPESLPRPDDMPPCGPRPQPRPESLPRPDDMPPCGPRPESRPPQDISDKPYFIELDPDRKGVPEPPTPQALLEARKLLDRARRQVMLGRTVEAVFTLEQAVQVLPDADPAYEAWLMLGQLRMVNPAWSARAIQALQNASRIRTREAEPWATMGQIYHRTGCESDAVACFKKALELDPSVTIPPGLDLNETPTPTPRVKPSPRS